jgi:hypothetical protein
MPCFVLSALLILLHARHHTNGSTYVATILQPRQDGLDCLAPARLIVPCRRGLKHSSHFPVGSHVWVDRAFTSLDTKTGSVQLRVPAAGITITTGLCSHAFETMKPQARVTGSVLGQPNPKVSNMVRVKTAVRTPQHDDVSFDVL